MKLQCTGARFCFSLGLLWFVTGCAPSTSPDHPNPGDTYPTPAEVLPDMMRGINIGNTLEPPDEGGWNNGPFQEYFFDDIRAAGFTTVRIPVRWDHHTDSGPPYTIHPDWLARVAQIVDWGLSRDLFIILNAHHEWWFVDNYTDSLQWDRFQRIWEQIATTFQDRSDHLLFEIINEPHGMSREAVDELNRRILAVIRQTNPYRIVIYSGNDWSGPDALMNAAVPEDDYVLGYFHSYDPWPFAGEGQGVWGNDADLAVVDNRFREVENWSISTGVPVMMSEFGAITSCDYNSRMLFYAAYVEAALRHHIAFQAWDDGGLFAIYDRYHRTWSEVKDILLYTYPDGPTHLEVTALPYYTAWLTWENRSLEGGTLYVERARTTPDFTRIAQLPDTSTYFLDTVATASNIRYYRVVFETNQGEVKMTPPVRIIGP
ncbi:MAG: glycoside hydrolase family 5 protein [Candidatus Neomarinimicrobiota bacterium]|nr:MAG: glycoside hydrolase family 5 protein [Candidatus Neomarinimicrobiota bacterium]